MSKLRILDLFATSIRAIDSLSELYNLENLSLWKTRVMDIGPLASLTNLRTLDLDETKVREISCLAALKKLRFLSVRQTSVQDCSTLLKEIPDLQIFVEHEPYGRETVIDLSEAWQVWYWTEQLSISDAKLRSAIKRHGNSANTIIEKLTSARRE
ncbi:DUF3606 domain-containing protein [Bradyrhizobium liaoningense]|nr:DUF3606 domain-containing protein [Bradyrhizobium liaoningense]